MCLGFLKCSGSTHFGFPKSGPPRRHFGLRKSAGQSPMSTWQNVFLENDMVTLKFSCGRSIIGFCGLGTGLGIPSARARKWPSQPDRGGCGLSFSRSQPSCRYQQDQPSHPPHTTWITALSIAHTSHPAGPASGRSAGMEVAEPKLVAPTECRFGDIFYRRVEGQ